jgi:hypothetical protein
MIGCRVYVLGAGVFFWDLLWLCGKCVGMLRPWKVREKWENKYRCIYKFTRTEMNSELGILISVYVVTCHSAERRRTQ